MKLLIACIAVLFITAAMPRFDFLRRKPYWLIVFSVFVGAAYSSLRVIGV